MGAVSMQLKIETFSNKSGGNAFFKAVTHPLAARAFTALLRRLAGVKVALYDPDGQAEPLAQLYDLAGLQLAGVFVQDVMAIGRRVLGRAAQPVTETSACHAGAVLVLAFEAERAVAQIRHLLPPGAAIESLDAIRIPDGLLANRVRYLDPLNFATNFVFFRDADGLSTRLVTANYWAGYGARATALWLLLFDADGGVLAEWQEPLGEGMGAIVVDSRAVRARFRLKEFTGQLFLHVVGAAGHDVVKYALDTFAADSESCLSATHDANSWPADFYAGLPAPASGETVTLWVQNSQPCPIPAGAIGLNVMGDERVARLDRAVAPFATVALDVASLLPAARWPQQLELRAGKYMVRPRYEVTGGGKRRIAHVNVERTDLQPDPKIAELGNLLGKGYLLPAPVLPRDAYRTIALPTPMATRQRELPLAVAVYDRDGREVARTRLGRIERRQSLAIDVDTLLNGAALTTGYGHIELLYDFSAGGEADGWLHALFRYEHRASRHAAETSFGAHVFNTALTYDGEPQSYVGRPPGLSTRLFLRLGSGGLDTLCHLIYPASTPWHRTSSTELVLHDATGIEVARVAVQIPCSGSLLWRYHERFGEAERRRAGDGAYVVVRDRTCRLFGYHGLLGRNGSFSLDHMFGF
ncbi:MAG TPA: hypothetical protein VMU87_11800 [Stellaceae bacterium]|nr:hypothetical protein [Stellaceae bacterium]